jgi:hypothetical protein
MAHIIPKIPQQLLLLSTTASTTQETNKKSTDLKKKKKKKKKKKWIDRFAMENCCCGWGGFSGKIHCCSCKATMGVIYLI